ncbi:CatB-related O-acetyltransferase [Aerophototrophica crusticola]|uniref:CatB-related O-acetyltransferase n=1 Tax=Aerophototrophica crusticola TaxID=1709002 RepID=A0A858R5W0_9PROT|nr:CatB-related O-acetyltransferase [Rhodospirillaceae bacterium B3]
MPVGPDPLDPHPMEGHPRVGFLKPLLAGVPNVEVGDYSYYDDPGGPERFRENILYHFDFTGDRLVIGKFCAIAWGTRFIMNGANHAQGGLSTYPFNIFGQGWDSVPLDRLDFPHKGDTVVGNDVWIGYEALVMPGVTIGDGAIVAARSVVTADVPPYAVVAGNPARLVRMRFPEEVVARLLALRWWDWEPERITRAIPAIMAGDLDALATFAPGA